MGNRELKFRVWDIANKCFQTKSASLSILLSLEYQGVIKSGCDDFIYQQYTGLKDSSGREIYEGDILKVHGTYYDRENRREELYGNVTVNHFCHGRSSGFDLFMSFERPIEVIGNIFETPELLEAAR